jgi:hypothetical protein
MLSADPAGRPQDPLAVYRQIQDCVAQVERRETMAKRLGVPFLSGAKIAALPSRSRRPFPMKIVALAAIVIALATLGSIAVASYLRHQRVRQAEEPIGVPIGVTQPGEAAPPVTTSAPTIAPAAPQPEQTAPATLAQKNQAPPVTANAPTIAPAPPQPEQTAQTTQITSIENQKSKIENAQAPPVTTSGEAIKPLPTAPEQTIPATVAQQTPPPTAPESTAAVVANNEPSKAPPSQPETTVARDESPKVAANETRADAEETKPPPPKAPVAVREEKPRRSDREVTTSTRSVTPEVRRAEPAPAEGPDEEVAPTVEKQVATVGSKPKKDRARKPKREVAEEEPAPRAEPVEDAQVAEAPMPQLPRNRTRAKFIGVTADGQWMFSLPNKKVVVVPPPPGG